MDIQKNQIDFSLMAVSRLSYFLLALPVLTDWLEDGALPRSRREWITEVAVMSVIAVFIYILHTAREELRRRDALRHDIIQAVMHDLKNPLTTAIGSLTALLEPRVGGKMTDTLMLEMALRGCRAQNILVDDILDADQLETGELIPKRTTVSAVSLIERTRDLIAGYAAINHVDIRWPKPRPAEDLLIDERLIKRVLANLIQNGIKYSPRDGVVSVDFCEEGSDYVLRVKDSGPGIPAEHFNRLFHKFHRVEGVNQAQRKGMGLGLYFCRLAVNAHGGAINVENADEGGAIFSVRLPGAGRLVQMPETGKEKQPCPMPEMESSGKQS